MVSYIPILTTAFFLVDTSLPEKLKILKNTALGMNLMTTKVIMKL